MQLPTPTLVDVRGADGRLRPALLLASRDERRFVQVHHAPGDNRLRWVVAGALRVPPAGQATAPAAEQALVTGSRRAVALSRPRAQH